MKLGSHLFAFLILIAVVAGSGERACAGLFNIDEIPASQSQCQGSVAKVEACLGKDFLSISYRRQDARYQARSIHAAFAREVGRENVFMDVDSIPPGAGDHVTKLPAPRRHSRVKPGHDDLSSSTRTEGGHGGFALLYSRARTCTDVRAHDWGGQTKLMPER